jgi:hypothetical protein
LAPVNFRKLLFNEWCGVRDILFAISFLRLVLGKTKAKLQINFELIFKLEKREARKWKILGGKSNPNSFSAIRKEIILFSRLLSASPLNIMTSTILGTASSRNVNEAPAFCSGY